MESDPGGPFVIRRAQELLNAEDAAGPKELHHPSGSADTFVTDNAAPPAPSGDETVARKIFHILAPKPRRGGSNRFYDRGQLRIDKTLCGALVTEHDIRFGWQAFSVGDYDCCQTCIEIRYQAKAKLPPVELDGSVRVSK